MSKTRPYFLWDYDLTENEVRRILRSDNEIDRLWLTGRILTNASYEDVWKYLTVKDIIRDYPKLKMRKEVKDAWGRALTAWGHHV